MNRFFSKLNLNDIKIKPDGNSFPPDADDELETTSKVVADSDTQVEKAQVAPSSTPSFFAKSSEKKEQFASSAPTAQPAEEIAPVAPVTQTTEQYTPAAPVAEKPNQYAPSSPSIEDADKASFEAEEFEEIEEVDPTPVHSNGHSTREISYEESTALYAAVDTAVKEEEPVTEIVSEGIVIGLGEVLKVSARSRPSAVAGAIAGVVREAGKAEVQAIGAGATNQAIKAVAIARDYLSESGIDAVCVPAFIDVTIENEERTAIRLVVEPR